MILIMSKSNSKNKLQKLSINLYSYLDECRITPVSLLSDILVKQYPSVRQVKFVSGHKSQ